jgi:hypothetical protein
MIIRKNLTGIVALSAMAISLAACSTSGTTRLAGIGSGSGGSGGTGTGTGQGGTGDDGSGSGTGNGSSGNGGTGTGGTGTGGTGTGSAGTLAGLPIGSITGPTGVANTGILPNTGQASQPSPLAPVLVTAGNAALGLSDVTGQLGGATGATGLGQVTNAVTQTLANTGNALKNGASGQTPLVDGITNAVSPVATVALGGTTLIGDGSGQSLVAVSAGQPATGNGTVVDLHLLKTSALPSAGNLLGAQVANTTLAAASGTPAVDVKVLSPNSPEAQALGVGVLSGGQAASVTAPALTGVTNQVASALTSVTSNAGGALPSGNSALGVQVAGAQVIPSTGTPAVDVAVLSPNGTSASALGVGVASGGKLLNVALPALTGATSGSTPVTTNPLSAIGSVLHH